MYDVDICRGVVQLAESRVTSYVLCRLSELTISLFHFLIGFQLLFRAFI